MEARGGAQAAIFHSLQDGGLFAFAGLWEGAAGQERFTILTTEANELLAPLHDRMPVILAEADYDRWLDPRTAPDDLQALLRPYPAAALVAHPVSARVNNIVHDDASCIEPRPKDQLLF